MNARRWRAVAVGAAGVCLVALGIVLYSQGLDNADKLASVGSLFVGLAALVVAVLAVRRKPETPVRRKRVDGRVRGTVIGGTVVGAEADRHSDDVVGVVDVGEVTAGGKVIGARMTEDDDKDG